MRTASIGEAITVAVLAAKKCGEVRGVTLILPEKPSLCHECSGELKNRPKKRDVRIWLGNAYLPKEVCVLVTLHSSSDSCLWHPLFVKVIKVFGHLPPLHEITDFSLDRIHAELYESSLPVPNFHFRLVKS